eukprot:1347055-Amorphochlora_amoeboformis.AAC.1
MSHRCPGWGDRYVCGGAASAITCNDDVQKQLIVFERERERGKLGAPNFKYTLDDLEIGKLIAEGGFGE